MVVFRKAMFKFGHRLICGNPRHIVPWSVVVAKTLIQHGQLIVLSSYRRSGRPKIDSCSIFFLASSDEPVGSCCDRMAAIPWSKPGQLSGRRLGTIAYGCRALAQVGLQEVC